MAPNRRFAGPASGKTEISRNNPSGLQKYRLPRSQPLTLILRSIAKRCVSKDAGPCARRVDAPWPRPSRRIAKAMLLRVRVGFCVCAARSLKVLAFHPRYSHCFTAANFLFDFIPSRNILSASRSVKGRAASVFVAWQRDAVVRHDAGLRRLRGLRFLKADGAHTPVTRADGPSVCPGDSSHERGASAEATNPGACSKPKIHRVRNAGEYCFRGGVTQR
jgi:hypothetical protein